MSARLHGLIFAAVAGVAGLGLDYEPKVRGVMADAGQAEACVSLPELAAGRLPAAIDTLWPRREMVALSDHVAVAIERAELYSDLQRTVRETLLLNRVIAASATATDAAGLMRIVCAELADAFQVARVGCALLDEGQQTLTVVAEFCAPGAPGAMGAVDRVKGSGLAVGARDLAALCDTLERRLRGGDHAAAAEMVPQVEARLAEAVAALQAVRDGLLA